MRLLSRGREEGNGADILDSSLFALNIGLVQNFCPSA
jgi:hypothetical protein